MQFAGVQKPPSVLIIHEDSQNSLKAVIHTQFSTGKGYRLKPLKGQVHRVRSKRVPKIEFLTSSAHGVSKHYFPSNDL